MSDEVKVGPAQLPPKMKAGILNSFQANEKEFGKAMSLQEVDFPSCGDDEIVVRVHAAGINPVDYKIAMGLLAMVAKALPRPMGFDYSGVVVKVGPACKRLKVGDAVVGMTHWRVLGSFAEYVAATEAHVALKPASMSFAEAASIPCVGLTGYQSLVIKSQLRPGQKVLILGGSGGTGSFGVQLAAAYSASRVVATCSERNIEFVKEQGATEVIDYTKQKWSEVLAGQDFDIVYDTVGEAESYESSLKVLKPTGVYFRIATKDWGPVSVGRLLSEGLVSVGRKLAGALSPSTPYYCTHTADTSRRDDLEAIGALFNAGKLKPLIEKAFPLEQFVECFEAMAAGRTRGKLVLATSPQANDK